MKLPIQPIQVTVQFAQDEKTFDLGQLVEKLFAILAKERALKREREAKSEPRKPAA